MVRLSDPLTGGRFNAMLVSILSPPWKANATADTFENDLVGWDTAINEYERQSNKKIDEDVRLAVVTQNAPASVRTVVL